jgi:hypothetical protein
VVIIHPRDLISLRQIESAGMMKVLEPGGQDLCCDRIVA